MSWRPQVDVLKSAANETEPADTQTSCRPTESDLGAQQVGDLTTRLHQVLVLWGRYVRNHATDNAAGNLTTAQLSILNTLIDLGPARMSDLAASELIRAPTARNSVLRLLRLGLVTRWRDPLDRRVARIAITARGRTARRRAVAARTQRIAAGLAQLNRQDREALRGALPLLELIAQTADTTGS
jgi:DNA-binding MarR family transcriptional regulator